MLIIFSILFIIEKKEINKILNYVGIILTTAIIITQIKGIGRIDGEYITYTLILVQISAITIIYGFVLMLFPKRTENEKRYEIYKKIITIIIIISIYILIYNIIGGELNIEEIERTEIEEINHTKIRTLRTIGEEIYTDPNNIMKLIIMGMILLLGIIGLFYIIS